MSTASSFSHSTGSSNHDSFCQNCGYPHGNLQVLAELILSGAESRVSLKKQRIDLQEDSCDRETLFKNNTFRSFSSKSSKEDCICCMEESCKTFMVCCQVAVCKDCFKKWTLENPTCPHCRVEIDK